MEYLHPLNRYLVNIHIMSSGYGLYGRDDIYLLETSLIYYGWKSGEIFLMGAPLSHILNELSMDKYSSYLLGDYSEFYLQILYEYKFRDEAYDKLAIINSFNGFSPIHFTYIVLRANGYGLYRSIETLLEMGEKYVCDSIKFYKSFISGYTPHVCPFKRDSYPGGRLPIWMDLARKIVYTYLKRVYPKLLDDFKVFDRRVRNLVRSSKTVCSELYTIYLVESLGEYTLLDIIVKPKLLVAEALYKELRRQGINCISIPPIYRGMLHHGLTRDIFKEES